MDKQEFYRLRSEIGAHARWAKEPDRAAATAKARRAFREKLEREVDPDGTLSDAERAFRAEHLWLAHQKRASLAAARARSAKAKARKQGGA